MIAPINVYLAIAAGADSLIVLCSAFKPRVENSGRGMASRRPFRAPKQTLNRIKRRLTVATRRRLYSRCTGAMHDHSMSRLALIPALTLAACWVVAVTAPRDLH